MNIARIHSFFHSPMTLESLSISPITKKILVIAFIALGLVICGAFINRVMAGRRRALFQPD